MDAEDETEQVEPVEDAAEFDDSDTSDEPEFQPPSTRRSLKELANDLWYQKPGPRENRPAPRTAKEIVNGLDEREYRYGLVASALALVTGIIAEFHLRGSGSVKDRNDSVVFFVSFLVGWACMLGGTLTRRRALLGFASFLVGLEMISYLGGFIGIIWLGFGFWLISRVMRKQRMDRDEQKAAAKARPKSRTSSGTVKASKRYTPPRTRSSSGKRR
jgi:hypothetical protein